MQVILDSFCFFILSDLILFPASVCSQVGSILFMWKIISLLPASCIVFLFSSVTPLIIYFTSNVFLQHTYIAVRCCREPFSIRIVLTSFLTKDLKMKKKKTTPTEAIKFLRENMRNSVKLSNYFRWMRFFFFCLMYLT